MSAHQLYNSDTCVLSTHVARLVQQYGRFKVILRVTKYRESYLNCNCTTCGVKNVYVIPNISNLINYEFIPAT